MEDVDLVIRGGVLADGLGGTPVPADVAISRGIVVGVGSVPAKGREEIDARGLLVTPGFVDIHTHLDGHVTWAQRLIPSSFHGVTTAVFGNCGVGFAPCRPDDRDRLVQLMEGVEDIPEPVLTEGLPWNWTSFPDYLNRLDERVYDIDVAAQLPHGALRVFVMGERAAKLEAATPDDIVRMAELADEAMRAGAIGFSTSRSINHRASTGDHTPTLKATEAELTAIACALGAAGGVIQMITDFDDVDAEFDMIERIARTSGRPLSLTLLQSPHAPQRWRQVLGRIAQANAAGVTIRGQVCGRPVGVIIGFEATFCPFSFCPTYQAMASLPIGEKLARLRDPETRRRIVAEFAVPLEERGAEIKKAFQSRTVDSRSTARLISDLRGIFPLDDPPDYEPSPDSSIAARAQRQGRPAGEVAYDMLLEKEGRTLFLVPASNFTDGTLDAAGEMIVHENTVLGLGDSGAHSALICDVSFSTTMLTHWARDRRPGLPVGEVVRLLTARPALAVGLGDRGIIAPGYRADINIIDMDRLRLHPPKVIYDLPAGGKRLSQEASGYVMTMVAGIPTYREGVPTGALPGRLMRRNRGVGTDSRRNSPGKTVSTGVENATMPTIGPLSDSVGVEIRDLDLSKQEQTPGYLSGLLNEHGLLLFRDQVLSKPSLVAATYHFGEPELHPIRNVRDEAYPELIVLSTHGPRGDMPPQNEEETISEMEWHTDLGYMTRPNRGAMLYGVELPPVGGQTGFTDRQKAYEALPGDLKHRIDGLSVIQSWTYSQHKFARNNPGLRNKDGSGLDDLDRFPDLVYPLVYRHPESGRKILNIAPMWSAGIPELPGEAGRRLLDELIAHAAQPCFVYWHQYRPGDVVVWDNWRMMHAASGTKGKYRRVMYRTTIKGTVELGRPLDRANAGDRTLR